MHGERRTAFRGCLKRRGAQSAQVLNQVSTTLLGLVVVFLGGVAVLMRPVERSIEELVKKVGAVETKGARWSENLVSVDVQLQRPFKRVNWWDQEG